MYEVNVASDVPNVKPNIGDIPQFTTAFTETEGLEITFTPRIVNPSRLSVNKPPELIWGALYQGGKLIISAPSKGRKTWALLHLAVSVSSGVPWLGFACRQSPVLFVDLELMPWESEERVQKIAGAMKHANLEDLHLVNLRGQRVDFATLAPRIIQFAKAEGVGLVVLDPFYRLAGGIDENSAGDIADFLFNLEQIASESEAAVAMVHHYAKGAAGAKDTIDRASGSGVFARDPDTLIFLTEHEQSTEDQPMVVAETRVRSFPPVRARTLRWKFPLWEVDSGTAPEVKKPRGRKASHTVDDILEILGSDRLTTSVWQKKAEGKGIPRSTFYELRNKAEKQNLIETRDGLNFNPEKQGPETPCQSNISPEKA